MKPYKVWSKGWSGSSDSHDSKNTTPRPSVDSRASGNCSKFSVNTGIPAVMSEIVLVFIVINLLLETTLGAVILLKGLFFQEVVEEARNAF